MTFPCFSSQWKRIKKQKAKAEKAAAKAAAKAKKEASQPKKAKKEEEEPDSLDPNQYYEIRMQKMKKFEADGYNPFPHKFDAKMSIPHFLKTYKDCKAGTKMEKVPPNKNNPIPHPVS